MSFTNNSRVDTVIQNNNSLGTDLSYEWDLDGDGNIDSVAKNPTFIYRSAGIYRVTLSAKNGYGVRNYSSEVRVTSNTSAPIIDVSKSPSESTFLGVPGTKITYNTFVDWKGTPGTVSFSVDGGPQITKNAVGNGVSHTFTIGQDISPGNARSTVNVVARNREGVASLTYRDYICVTSVSSVLQSVGLQTDALGDRVKFTFETPRIPPSRIAFPIPGFGNFSLGIGETFAKGEAEINFGGRKTANLFLTSEFEALNNTVGLEGGGSADFDLRCPDGLKLLGGAARVGGDVTITKEVGILEAVPGLSAAFDIPVIGNVIRTISDSAKIGYRVNPGVEFSVALKQGPTGNLDFREITGKTDIKIDGFTKVSATDNVSLEAFVGGGGSGEIGYPAPLLRQVQVNVTAGAKYEVDAIFKLSGEYRYSYACGGVGGNISCSGGSSLLSDNQNLANHDGKEGIITPIFYPYETFGKYETFQVDTKTPSPASKDNIQVTDSSLVSEDAVLVSNVFPGASPALLQVGNGKLALWERQDTSLPTHQSTNISWSFFDGTTWSSPGQIVADTRAEFAPVASVDQSGKAVAAWLRIKDQSYSAPISTVDDMARFYTRLEVVSATFNSVTRSWSTPIELTNDTAFDTSLRLVSNGSGQLMLLWISNPKGEFISTTTNPSIIKYSLWNGSSWTVPANVSTGQIGISTLSAAFKGNQAIIVLARDPNPNTTDDTVIDLYRWNGSWQSALIFAAGGGGNVRPSATFDAQGEGQIAWLRGSNLVQATLSNPSPNIVRQGSATLPFLGTQLLTNSQGNLTVLWQQAGVNTPPNLFARIYDPATKSWSADRLLNSSPAMARDVSAYYGNDGAIHVAYLSTEITIVAQTVIIDGKPQTINNIPQSGRTDLRILDHSLVVDLSVGDQDLLILPARAKRGDSVKAELAIHNNGDFSVGGFKIDLYVGNPENNGILLGTAIVNDTILAGGQRIVTIPFIYPAKEEEIVAVVDSANSIRESVENNNRAKSYVIINVAPQARIIASKTQGMSPLVVEFDASSSYDGDKDGMIFNWVYGDGTVGANGAKVAHTFDKPGCYNVTLVATDVRGASSATSVTITVIDKSVSISAASFSGNALAGEMIVAMFGNNLASEVNIASQLPLPNALSGTTVRVKDSAGIDRIAPLFFVSPSQINYQIPQETAIGAATITVTASDGCVSTESVQIANVAPGIFSANANGQGVAAGVALRVKPNGQQIYEPIVRFDPAQNKFISIPIDLGPATDQVFLILFGTGVRGFSSPATVKAMIGRLNAEVFFVGPQGGFAGLDQINLAIPNSLGAPGEVDVVLTSDDKVSNTVKVSIGNATNPTPSLTNLNPSSATAGGAAFTVTVNGSNFISGSIVRWNGSNRTTAFISNTQLTAQIPASDIITTGTTNVSVFNPAPGGGISNNSATFTINPSCSYTIQPTSQSFAAAGSTGSVNVAAASGCAWAAASNASFITITSGASGNGNGTVSYSVAANTNTASRTGTITIAGRTFTVTQSGASPNPTPSLTNLNPSSATAGGAAFTVTVNGSNFISGSIVRWNGSNRTTAFISNTQLTAQVLASDIAAMGVASVSVFNPAPGGGISNNSATFTINPSCSYTIQPTSQSFAAAGSTGSVNVAAASGCAWAAASNASFITITSGASGNGNGTVSYSVAANTNTASRTGTMTIAGQTFTVTQCGNGSFICEQFNNSPTQASLNGAATYDSTRREVRLTPDELFRAGSIFFTPTTLIDRFTTTFQLRIDGQGADGMTFAVIDSGANSLGQAAAGLGYEGLSGRSFAIEFDTFYNSEHNDPLITPHIGLNVNGQMIAGSITTGNLPTIQNQGNLTVQVMFDRGAVQVFLPEKQATPVLNATIPNWTPFMGRFGFTAATGGLVQTHVVDSLMVDLQGAGSCSNALSSTSRSFNPSGGTGSVSVTTASGCAWAAASNASFITITSSTGGFGNGTVSYSVAANTSTSPRTGTMTIAGQTFTATQSGSVINISVVDHRITAGPIPDPCEPPYPRNIFTLSDALVYHWVSVRGAYTGDVVRWEFISPAGSIHDTSQYTVSFGGDGCFWSARTSAPLLGNWQVRVFYNGTLFMTDFFTVTQ